MRSFSFLFFNFFFKQIFYIIHGAREMCKSKFIEKVFTISLTNHHDLSHFIVNT